VHGPVHSPENVGLYPLNILMTEYTGRAEVLCLCSFVNIGRIPTPVEWSVRFATRYIYLSREISVLGRGRS
jgi:hypothetical protein